MLPLSSLVQAQATPSINRQDLNKMNAQSWGHPPPSPIYRSTSPNLNIGTGSSIHKRTRRDSSITVSVQDESELSRYV